MKQFNRAFFRDLLLAFHAERLVLAGGGPWRLDGLALKAAAAGGLA